MERDIRHLIEVVIDALLSEWWSWNSLCIILSATLPSYAKQVSKLLRQELPISALIACLQCYQTNLRRCTTLPAY